jgi:hypothetical protein
MRFGSAMLGRSRGVLALLAFLLSLVPAAGQATVAAAPDGRLVGQLAATLAWEAAVQATLPATAGAVEPRSEEPDPDGGVEALAPRTPDRPPLALRSVPVLPPSTAPPARNAAAGNRARAPPLS